jgi:hypothetical protein
MIRVEPPDHAGSRDQAQTLAATLPADLEGETVLLDCSDLMVGAPSFFDEMVKQVLLVRSADALEISGARDRARDLLERAAQNRNVRERLRVAAPTA